MLCLREVRYFLFVHVFVLTLFVALAWKQPVLSYLSCFLRVFTRKNRVTNAINAEFGWHTWWRRLFSDFWLVGGSWWVTKLTFANLVLVKTTFSHNFVVDERSTIIFPPALHVADNYACGLWSSKEIRTRLRSRFRINNSDLQIGVRGRGRVRVWSSEHAHYESFRRSNLKRVLSTENSYS